MTLEQLRVFLEVARHQHVTQAARALNLSQSAVSAAIATLEGHHGVALFDRVGRGIALNAAGRQFLPHAERVLRGAAEATAWLSEFHEGQGGELHIEASQTVASYFLPRHLVDFQARHPRVALRFQQGNTASVAEAVRRGTADLGMIEGQVTDPDLSVEAIGGDRLLLIVGPGHPWRDGRQLGVGDLAGAEWVLREVGSGTRAVFDAEIARLGLETARLRQLLELPSNEACIAAVKTGRGATVLSALAAAPHLAQGWVFEAGFPFPARTFSVIGHRARHRSRHARNFIAMMHEPGGQDPGHGRPQAARDPHR